MSKTVSTCVLETNLVPNQPQENIFFHTLYRTMSDFPGEFVRTARSTSPIQVVAIFSTQGPDTNAALLNIELNQELSKIVSNAQGQPVLDFESFSNQVVNNLNVHVCNFIVSHGGNPLRTSMTMAVIEGDTLRIIHIGNTKAVLIRDGKIMAITDEQTVAHRYVQMGAISPAEEANHPDRFSLTQYLGKMPQDGPVMPDKKVHLKLKDNDSLCLMGIGISKFMPAKNRNSILIREMSTEAKAHEVVNTAGNLGVKFGLTFAIVEVESTLILPGEAVMANRTPAPSVNEEIPFVSGNDPFGSPADNDTSETTVFNRGASSSSYEYDDFEADSPKKPSVAKTIIRTIVIFLICAVLGYGAMLGLFYYRGLVHFGDTKPSEEMVDTIMYIAGDGTRVYAQPSEDSAVIDTLTGGTAVAFLGDEGSYSKIKTTTGNIGYVLNVNLIAELPDAANESAEQPQETLIEEEGELEVMDDPNGNVGEPDSLGESVDDNGEIIEDAPVAEEAPAEAVPEA
ncbi:MAG: SH3 domain-containing protein [Clostridiales bacterium]|nr:SH3 domain-containing protein [Clostridiales bacterium]